MEVYALHGPSGTGKSSSALLYAHNHHIPAIIDDGLLIYQGKKLAGRSAKYEKNYITAVKRATFFFEDHAEEVRQILGSLPITRILLIGTSKRMVDLIANKLQIGKIDHYIDINDIRSSAEIKLALFIRRTQGKHIIPIPYAQVEQNFFKKLIAKGHRVLNRQKEVIGETTVVEPNFQMGSITISPDVLKKIVIMACRSVVEVSDSTSVKISMGDLPTVTADIHLKADIGVDLIAVSKRIQESVHRDFLNYLSIELYSVHLRLTQYSPSY